MKCDCIGAPIGHHTQECLDREDQEHGEKIPHPLELNKSTTYNSAGRIVTVGLNDDGDIYEAYIGSAAEARKLAKWLLGWSDWKEGKK